MLGRGFPAQKRQRADRHSQRGHGQMLDRFTVLVSTHRTETQQPIAWVCVIYCVTLRLRP